MPFTFGAGNNSTPPNGTVIETADDPGNGLRQIVAVAKGTMAHGAVAPNNSADLIVAANADRKAATFYNNGSVVVYLGDASVTTSTGYPLPPGATFSDFASGAAWYGITATATAGDIRYVEVT